MDAFSELLSEVRHCRLCEAHLPLGPRPVVQLSADARLLIIGQAPGTRVHASGKPWDDPSGDRLRGWLQMDRQRFYHDPQLGIMPMGFCYPGKGRSGDLPPRPECAPTWHQRLREHMPNIALTLLIGQYAQRYYLPDVKKGGKPLSLTDRVRNQPLDGDFLCLPHPSPRNIRWFRHNAWFDDEIVPALQSRLCGTLDPYLPVTEISPDD
ncbi:MULTISPECIES: uracil-DNA glycosylase family protein [Spongiibacter]|uniref:uracil-DNA glycosylase family protein n=1 Tax=Spongiibacter TaxID=630749 RepID=UPI000C56600C|nr:MULTISPECIES: uracil-DNA glycosylase family protein [Spongiibacter]MAY38236.1 IclR family transcriptional regulator [Spongiibacter sp.]|tara:strand:- start:27499 stop:28125 length:627 start_codon:yes stop_codon:yes gene_type:complete